MLPSNITDEERTTPIGLARYAYEYIGAAILVDQNASERQPQRVISPIPAYFLAHHGIELTLKSYLRKGGLSVRELARKTYGHDLHACYRKSKELGMLEHFKEHPNDLDALRLLEELNAEYGLRYIKTGAKSFPLWSIVEPLAVRLHQAVARVVGFHSFTLSYPAYGDKPS